MAPGEEGSCLVELREYRRAQCQGLTAGPVGAIFSTPCNTRAYISSRMEVFVFLKMLRCGITDLHENSTFNSLRTLHIVLHEGYTDNDSE